MPALSFHRKGTAVGYMYITTIHAEGTGWGWKGHKRAVGSRSGDPGPVVVSGEVYAEVGQAEEAADVWFYNIPNVIELTPSADQGISSPRPSPVASAPAPSLIEPRVSEGRAVASAPAPSLIEPRVSEGRAAASAPAPSLIEPRISDGRPATVREEMNKGLNFFGTATFAILASGSVPGLALPDDRPHKIEDIIVVVIAAAATGRYLWGKNRYRRSLAPLWFLILGLVTKIAGAWVRTGSPIPVGSDLGMSLCLIVTGIVFGWQFSTTRTRE